MKLIWTWTLLLWLAPISVQAQIKMTSFHKLDSLQASNPKPVFVFIHTDWCKFCVKMKAKTLQNDSVLAVLTSQYHLVGLNAEDTATIRYAGKVYRFKPTGNQSGIHELALALGASNGDISYPALCILNESNEINFRHNGYLSANNLLAVLKAHLQSLKVKK